MTSNFNEEDWNKYQFKLSEKYLINENENAIYYKYDVPSSQFIKSTTGIYRKILDETDAASTNLLDFKEIDIVSNSNGEYGGIRVTKEGADSPIMTSYDWHGESRAFVKHNGIYIIDPWDSYQEVETYYYPIDTTQKVVRNNFLEIIEDQDTSLIGQRFILYGDSANDLINSLYILKVTLKNFGDYDLTACFPIAIKQGDIYSNGGRIFMPAYLEGPTDVRYATSGELDFNKNPYYLKNYILSDQLELEEDEIEGHFELFGESFFIEEEEGHHPGDLRDSNDINFSPQLVNSYWYKEISPEANSSAVGYYELKENSDNDYILTTDNVVDENKQYFEQKILSTYLSPPMVYFKETPIFGVRYVLDVDINENITTGTVLWTQPVYVYQDNYPSTTLNKWNGKDITTDDNTGTIVASGFAAGKKERDNTFTGVVLGDWSRTDTDAFVAAQTGVYGFNHGGMSYALKDDGSAFFGKDGRGRIYLNGNKAQIYSANWLKEQSSAKNGMLIDIDDGKIEMLSATSSTKAHVYLQTLKSPYFYVDINTHKLIYIGSDNYYLQSENWVNNSSGIQFDLKEGKIELYRANYSETFTKYQVAVASGVYTASTAAQTITGDMSVKINSQDLTYPLRIGNNFKVSWGGIVDANGGKFDNLNAKGADFQEVNISKLVASNGQISYVNSDHMDATNITAKTGTLENLTVTGLLNVSSAGNNYGGIFGANVGGGNVYGNTVSGNVVYAREFQIVSTTAQTVSVVDWKMDKPTTESTTIGTLGFTKSDLPASESSTDKNDGVGLESSGGIVKVTAANVGMSHSQNYVTVNSGGGVTISGSGTITINGAKIQFTGGASSNAENQTGIYARFG